MIRPQLKVQKRTVLGKKVKKLRREGIIPANIYGKNIPSEALQVEEIAFRKLYSKASESTVIDLLVGKSAKPRHVLVRNIQKNPVSGQIMHIDFQQIDLKEEIEAEVAIRLEGEPELVRDKKAMLIQELNEIDIKTTPEFLPKEITLDVAALKSLGDVLRVKDIAVSKKIAVLTDPERVVARLDELVSEEAEQLAEEEAAAAAEASAEGAETEVPEKASDKEPAKEPEKQTEEDSAPEKKAGQKSNS